MDGKLDRELRRRGIAVICAIFLSAVLCSGLCGFVGVLIGR